jgi:hypothetical protein
MALATYFHFQGQRISHRHLARLHIGPNIETTNGAAKILGPALRRQRQYLNFQGLTAHYHGLRILPHENIKTTKIATPTRSRGNLTGQRHRFDHVGARLGGKEGNLAQ